MIVVYIINWFLEERCVFLAKLVFPRNFTHKLLSSITMRRGGEQISEFSFGYCVMAITLHTECRWNTAHLQDFCSFCSSLWRMLLPRATLLLLPFYFTHTASPAPSHPLLSSLSSDREAGSLQVILFLACIKATYCTREGTSTWAPTLMLA